MRNGEAHAALVFQGEECVGWCQFGSPEELPRIKFGKAYREGATRPPNWRITCFFVDSRYRHKGVAAAALGGALQEIARLGGGTVESMPEDVEGRKVSNSFLYNATVAMFERQGFTRATLVRPTLAVRAAREAVKVEKAGGLLHLARDVGRVQAKADAKHHKQPAEPGLDQGGQRHD